MTLDHITLLFLVLIFAAAEIYRATRAKRGVILAVESSPVASLLLPVTNVRVRLGDGSEISAQVNCCTACLGRLRVGDEVRLSDTRSGYVVELPWLNRSRCSSRGTA
jgi:hypothetical protein